MGPSEEELEAESPLGKREEVLFLFILKKETEITVGNINGKKTVNESFL